ncbi:unnamed protein product [Cylindrotheca closterium]|uniref:Alkaline ceramidase n=1 Tax=Cylindrotheca closterium TaxID=2856 RepID=A0AAD2CF42_9STRA|nr:unnamed protein product [Cylindrotheca closterium]
MPQNLDQETRNSIFWVSVIIDSSLVVANLVIITRKIPKAQRKDVSLLLWGCLKTLVIMGILSHVCTEALIQFGTNATPAGVDEDHYHVNTSDLSSSINFCENDFVHSRHVAEPSNSISSLTTYCPLALLGLHLRPHSLLLKPDVGKLRFTLAYLSLFAIGLGSFWLHSQLTAVSQGGDELPILWYLGIATFIVVDCLLDIRATPGAKKHRTSLWLVGFSTISSAVATLTYIFNREDFFFFHMIFTTYLILILLGEGILTFSDFSKYGDSGSFREKVLLPLVSCNIWVYLSASFLWVSEMLFCHDATTDFRWGATLAPWIFDRAIHAGWHCTSALLVFMTIQILLSVWGFQQGWGEPQLRWFGAPYVYFEKKTRQA